MAQTPEEAIRALLTAVKFAGRPTEKWGPEAGPCYEARIPEQFVIDVEAALARRAGGYGS